MLSERVYMPPTQGGAIAQLGERLNGIQEVVGSIPIGSTTPTPAFGFESYWEDAAQPVGASPRHITPKAPFCFDLRSNVILSAGPDSVDRLKRLSPRHRPSR